MSQRADLPGAQNLQMSVDKSILYLYCDLAKSVGPSSSGKTVLISSSSGNKPLGKSGAFLGFNIYTKSLESRNLTASGVGELRTDAFTAVGVGCQWRVEADGHTLCIKVDFGAVTPRAAASGKSMLLATTSGNKLIAKSGLSCGLNLYYPAAGTFTASRLMEGAAAGDELQVGQTATLDGGFVVHYAAANTLSVQFAFRPEEMADGHVASLPSFRLGDVTVALSIGAIKAARARTEKAGDSTPKKVSGGGGQGGFVLAEGKENKVCNVSVTCAPASASASTKKKEKREQDGEAAAYDLVFTLDPTQQHKRTASGKSLTVASTAGFQRIADAAGNEVCRASLNAYRPAPPLTDDEIVAAVEAVLSAKPASDLPDLSFRDVLAEVMEALGVGETMKDSLRTTAKDAVTAFLKRAAA